MLELFLLVWDLNQGNPSIKIVMDLFLKTRSDLHFLLHAICNRLQPFATGAVWHGKKSTFGRFYPHFYGFYGDKTTKSSLRM
jgi:hypothetical protein